MCHADIQTRISDTLNDVFRGTGNWAYLVAVFGDDKSGDCVYSSSGDLKKAAYTINGADCTIDTAAAVDVMPLTTYEVETEETGVQEADTKTSTAVTSPTSTSTSTKAYTAGNITVTGGAGAGATSVTISLSGTGLVPEQEGVSATEAHVIEAGRRNSARDQDILQAIHDHVSCLGANCSMKEAEKDATNSRQAGLVESAATGEVILKIVESSAFPIDIPLREAFTVGKKIKLIAPGAGSTAYYTEAALKQAATDKIFHAGLPMRIDHPTKAEESARPEGSVKDWGAVLGSDAAYLESYISAGKDQGPGLYSDIKPFSDHAKTIEEKGPYAGVSIMANGKQLHESGRPVTKNGLPVLEKFTSAEGADMVTRAGAGGLFLQESARTAETPTQEASMDADELKLLRESVARLSGKETRREAIQEGARILRDVSLPDTAKEYVISTVLKEALPMKDGALDVALFTEAVNAEAKRFGQAIGIGPRVTGMGAGAPVVEITEAQRTEQAAQQQEENQMYAESWATLLEETPNADGKYRLAEVAVRGRAN